MQHRWRGDDETRRDAPDARVVRALIDALVGVEALRKGETDSQECSAVLTESQHTWHLVKAVLMTASGSELLPAAINALMIRMMQTKACTLAQDQERRAFSHQRSYRGQDEQANGAAPLTA